MVETLKRDHDGLGIIADDGKTYRQFYFDPRPFNEGVYEGQPSTRVDRGQRQPVDRAREYFEWSVITPSGPVGSWTDGPWQARAQLKEVEAGSYVARRHVRFGAWEAMPSESRDSQGALHSLTSPTGAKHSTSAAGTHRTGNLPS